MDGTVNPCCRSTYRFGNFLESSLGEVWKSREATEFREKISRGEIPNDECRRCLENGTNEKLERATAFSFQIHQNAIERLFLTESAPEGFPKNLSELPLQDLDPKILREITPLLNRTELTPSELSRVRLGREFLSRLRARFDWPLNTLISIDKLDTILRLMLDYFHGELQPAVQAPFRQIELISVCNARCIHCHGLFTGEITRGRLVNGGRFTVMSDQTAEKSLEHPQDITDFFMNGSEFLLYKKWFRIARTLRDNGIRLSISSNGTLLNRSNVDLLIDNDFIACLNVSFDGARKDTIQKIRVNVDFDSLRSNVRYIFRKASVSGGDSNFNLSFSFALMTLNYEELPELYPLIDLIRAGWHKPYTSVLIQALDGYQTPEYTEFALKHHHRNIPKNRLIEVFDRAREASIKYRIPTSVFYTWDINEFNPSLSL